MAALVWCCAGCSSAADTARQVRAIDLVNDFDRAELRPRPAPFRLAQHTLGSTTHATIVTPAASRMIWTLALPRRAAFRASVAVAPGNGVPALRFRVGVSDERIYEALSMLTVTTGDTAAAGWIPIEADLSLYAGIKFSLFYRPEGRRWRLVLSTDQVDGSAEGLWGAPRVETDTAAARRFRDR